MLISLISVFINCALAEADGVIRNQRYAGWCFHTANALTIWLEHRWQSERWTGTVVGVATTASVNGVAQRDFNLRFNLIVFRFGILHYSDMRIPCARCRLRLTNDTRIVLVVVAAFNRTTQHIVCAFSQVEIGRADIESIRVNCVCA